MVVPISTPSGAILPMTLDYICSKFVGNRKFEISEQGLQSGKVARWKGGSSEPITFPLFNSSTFRRCNSRRFEAQLHWILYTGLGSLDFSGVLVA